MHTLSLIYTRTAASPRYCGAHEAAHAQMVGNRSYRQYSVEGKTWDSYDPNKPCDM